MRKEEIATKENLVSLVKVSLHFFFLEKRKPVLKEKLFLLVKLFFLRKGLKKSFAIAAVFLIAAVGSASADTPIASCDFDADTPGERYYLTGDLTCSAGEQGIIIGADGVRIDGQGHKMTGAENATACTGIGEQGAPYGICGILNVYHDNVEIKNLELENFCTGIRLQGDDIDKAVNNTISNCSIHHNGNRTAAPIMKTHGVHTVYVRNLTVTKNAIYNNTGSGSGCGDGGNGIFMFGGGGDYPNDPDYNVISCNKLYNNVKGGFWTKMKLDSSEITYNRAWGNGWDTADSTKGGIIMRCKKTGHNYVAFNNASDNPGLGMYVGGCNNTIKYNTVVSNAEHGIIIGRADGGDYNEISYNTACNNDHTDIRTCSGGAGACDWSMDDGCCYNTGNNNTCGLCNNCGGTNSISCGWGCANLASVYYDFDEDNYYSDEPENCVCGVGACCNPGLFNGSEEAKASYGASCNCQWTVGDDPNDCNASITGAGEATFEKDLLKGWNLVSLPLIPSDKQVSSVLNSIDGQYDAVVRYNAATHQFVTLSGSDEMENGVGYFIHMTVNGTWSYQGTAYESINVGLSQGLNCVGWTNTSANLPGALNSIAGSYKYVARWNAASQSYEAYEPNAPPPFNDFTTMNRGDGYWIATKGSCTLTYP